MLMSYCEFDEIRFSVSFFSGATANKNKFDFNTEKL
jgi:hypothetical protein